MLYDVVHVVQLCAVAGLRFCVFVCMITTHHYPWICGCPVVSQNSPPPPPPGSFSSSPPHLSFPIMGFDSWLHVYGSLHVISLAASVARQLCRLLVTGRQSVSSTHTLMISLQSVFCLIGRFLLKQNCSFKFSCLGHFGLQILLKSERIRQNMLF